MTKPHNGEKDAHETATMLRFLPFLAEYGGKDYASLARYLAEAKQEVDYIYRNHGKLCHNLNNLTLGQGEIPVLYKNTAQNESQKVNHGCDFILNLREGMVQEIAKTYAKSAECINLTSWPRILFEITECVDENYKRVSRTPHYAAQLPQSGYNTPTPRSVEIDKRIKKANTAKWPDIKRKIEEAEVNRYIEEANDPTGIGICGDRGERQWAEKAIFDIKQKIDKYNKKRAELAAAWAAAQKKQFPAVLKAWEENNDKIKKAHQKNGATSLTLPVNPSCPTEKDWLGYIQSLNEIWLLINSEYWLEPASPLSELAPYLIWQAGKEGLEDFLPFRHVIIMTSQGCLVFRNNFCNYEIWPQKLAN